MRIVQVSAHFPPDFVSGGTLVPHRTARAVARAGHESHVYAGHLDPAKPPLTTWTDEPDDLDGARVRWISTHPFTAWDDPRNWNNPDVEADAEQWFAQLRPDVVHAHSLQTLGVGVLRAAKASGARVVLTMHDFWWSCARQFLADRDLRPCSLVVSCGTCRCQVDQGWLSRRTAEIAPCLDDVDLVLAPSATTARVFEANGLAPGRVRVAENGLPGVESAPAWAPPAGPDGSAPAPRPVRAGEVRFMFAGGTDPMKGLGTLREALDRLGRDVPSGWSIDLYNTASAPAAPGAGPVREQPAYGRDELPGILADHDVLVLPSIMRESHSILTREALTAGLTVVCTDTLGPEEAVEHGRNGLVVPAADATALAAALAELARDPRRVAELAGHGSATPLLSFDEHAARVLDIYAELAGFEGPDERAAEAADPALAGGTGGTGGTGTTGALVPVAVAPQDTVALAEVPIPDPVVEHAGRLLLRRVVFLVGIQGAPLRYRAQLPAEGLRALGIHVDVRHYRDPELPELVDAADAVVVYRVPATIQVRELLERVRRRAAQTGRAIPVLHDVDDLIFDPRLRGDVHGLEGMSEAELDLWWRGVARYRTTMEQADMFIASTEELARHARETTGLPARRFANGVGALLARASDDALRRPRTPGPLRVGYFSGTTTHNADWAFVEPVLIRLMKERPDLELWLVGHLTPTSELASDAALEGRVRTLPFTPWHELPRRLRDVDVCLAPLTEDSRFNEAKSAIKWLEAALVETPVVASPTQPFRESVDEGRTGFLPTSRDGWYDAIAALLDDEVLRRRMGTQARREALLRWSPHLQGEVYLRNILAAADHVRAHGPRRIGEFSGWEPVEDDEPLSAAEAVVEPYEVPGAVQAGVRGRLTVLRRRAADTTAGRYAQAARRVYRAEGTSGVARKARVVARRMLGR